MPFPAQLKGNWVLDGPRNLSELQGSAGSAGQETTTTVLNYALSYDNVRGLSVRIPWSALDIENTGTPTSDRPAWTGTSAATWGHPILDKAYDIANTRGLRLAIRFMAGWNCPARFFGSAPLVDWVLGATTPKKPASNKPFPVPFKKTSTATNFVAQTGFYFEYDRLVTRLVEWAQQADKVFPAAHGSGDNSVDLIHLAMFGQNYAELAHSGEVKNASGYSANNFIQGHKGLIDIAWHHRGRGVTFEMPLSGFGSDMVSTNPVIVGSLADYITRPVSDLAPDVTGLYPAGAGGFGDYPTDMVIQANGWGDDKDWVDAGTTPGTPGYKWLTQAFRAKKTRRAEQEDFVFNCDASCAHYANGAPGDQNKDWVAAFDRLRVNQAEYCEIYMEGFYNQPNTTGGVTHPAQPGARRGSDGGGVLQTQMNSFKDGYGPDDPGTPPAPGLAFNFTPVGPRLGPA